MLLRWTISLTVVLISSLVEADLNFSRAEISCDDLLKFAFPDLCEMDVTRDTILIRGLKLVFWRYRSKHGTLIDATKVPVLMVHGGPALNHNYILPMKQQVCRGREVVFYDQVGAGQSSQPVNVSLSAPWLLTITYYNEEVEAIVKKLGWNKFHFFGSSWGTVIGQSYALLQDPRLQSIVLSGPLSDGQLYWKSQWDSRGGNLGSLPLYVQNVLHNLEEAHAYNSPLYAAEDKILTSFFTTRTTPLPDCFKVAVPSTSTNLQIYVAMQGPSEFSLGGVLSRMNFTPRLHEIKNPVLLTHGRYDTMRPAVIDAMYKTLPHAWRAFMPRSGHCSMIDDPRLMNDVVGEFFDHAESGKLDEFAIPSEAVDPGDVPLTINLDSPHNTKKTCVLVVTSLLIGVALGSVLTVGAMSQFLERGRRWSTSGDTSSKSTFLLGSR